jgi:hypothetical protein
VVQESTLGLEIAAAAARLVVDEGLDYGEAKRKAARAFGSAGSRALPSNEAVEDEVRTTLALFHADTQPAELAALRALSLRWMRKLAAHRPHVAGAVWRGTATLRSCVRLELYADDPKMTAIELANLGIDDTVGPTEATIYEHHERLRSPDGEAWHDAVVTLWFEVHDADALRGALKPDNRGQTWRGDIAALERASADAARLGAGG